MIQQIEKQRIISKISKAELCRSVNISVQMYYRYLKSNVIPYHIIVAMLNRLDLKIIIASNTIEP